MLTTILYEFCHVNKNGAERGGGANLTNVVDGWLHVTELIGLSVEQTQDATGQCADLVGNAGQWLGGEGFSFLQRHHAAVTWLTNKHGDQTG